MSNRRNRKPCPHCDKPKRYSGQGLKNHLRDKHAIVDDAAGEALLRDSYLDMGFSGADLDYAIDADIGYK